MERRCGEGSGHRLPEEFSLTEICHSMVNAVNKSISKLLRKLQMFSSQNGWNEWCLLYWFNHLYFSHKT